jgi:mannose-6-phosphate isomerase-like protein (cupin superfamily)
LLIKKTSLKSTSVEKPKDGVGLLHRWDYIKEQVPCARLASFSYIELEPGASIGKHQHVDNFEVYYFISGEGKAVDNDDEVAVRPGDLLLTERGGHHALINTGKTNISFIAFIGEQDA